MPLQQREKHRWERGSREKLLSIGRRNAAWHKSDGGAEDIRKSQVRRLRLPSGLEQSGCTLGAEGIPSSGSEGQEELGCRSGHVARHKEEFHRGFKEKNICDVGIQGKMGDVENEGG